MNCCECECLQCSNAIFQFVSNLLLKFKKFSDGVASADGGSIFAKHIAESLSNYVQSNKEFMMSECPICLDKPRIEDAIHSEFTCTNVVTIRSNACLFLTRRSLLLDNS